MGLLDVEACGEDAVRTSEQYRLWIVSEVAYDCSQLREHVFGELVHRWAVETDVGYGAGRIGPYSARALRARHACRVRHRTPHNRSGSVAIARRIYAYSLMFLLTGEASMAVPTGPQGFDWRLSTPKLKHQQARHYADERAGALGEPC
jgi:hypothetical protein